MQLTIIAPLLGGVGEAPYLMHDATPKAPARAVSTAINTLSHLAQSMEALPIPPWREGAAEAIILFFISVLVCLK